MATMVVGGVLSTGVSAAQHCCQCWPDVQCETDPSMYLYVFALTIFFVCLLPVSFICICQ